MSQLMLLRTLDGRLALVAHFNLASPSVIIIDSVKCTRVQQIKECIIF